MSNQTQTVSNSSNQTQGSGEPRKARRKKRQPRSMTPMVHFDSRSKCLLLTRTVNIDGEQLVTPAVTIPLGSLREDCRQIAIAVAKLVVRYANGVELQRPRVSKSKTGETVQLPSFLQEFNTLVGKLYVKPTPNEGPETATSEVTAQE